MKKTALIFASAILGVVALAAVACGQTVVSPKRYGPPVYAIGPDECNLVHSTYACFSDGAPPDIPLDDYRGLFFLARDDLAQRHDVGPAEVKIRSVERVEWPDASLGDPEPGVAYAQVITPGFRLILDARGDAFTYHTSTDRVVLVDINITDPDDCSLVYDINACFIDGAPPRGVPLDEYMLVYVMAREEVGWRARIELTEVKLKSVERVDWPDASLGRAVRGVLYAQVITPGFRLALEAAGETFTFHTSTDRVVFVDPYAPPGIYGHPQPDPSSKDASTLMGQTLEWALVEKLIPGYRDLSDPANVILLADNIDPANVPEIPGVTLMFLDSAEIQAIADDSGDTAYLTFWKLDIQDDDAEVGLRQLWAIGTDADPNVYRPDRGSCTLLFSKQLFRGWVWGNTMTCRMS